MAEGYVYDHSWSDERVRLAGLESALDPGTRDHLIRLGAAPGSRCLEVGAGGGSIALWLGDLVAPGGEVVATDLEIDFLEREASGRTNLRIIRHDVSREDLPADFDIVHARYLIEWLPDKRVGLARLAAALRPGGVMLVEEPDWVTMFETAEPLALRRVIVAAMNQLEAACPIDVRYGRRIFDDMCATGLHDVSAEGRCPVVRGGSPAAKFLRLTVLKLRDAMVRDHRVDEDDLAQAVAVLEDSTRTMYMPMTVAAWGRKRVAP